MNIDLTDHDSLVQRPISANPRINLNPGFIITLFKSLFFLDNHPYSFKSIILSNCKQKQSQFSLKAFRSEIKLLTLGYLKPALSKSAYIR